MSSLQPRLDFEAFGRVAPGAGEALRVLGKLGVDSAKLDLAVVWTDVGSCSERERGALAWTKTLTQVAAKGVSDAAYAALRDQFTEHEAAS